MHASSSFPTSDRTIRWIENLADQERTLGPGDGAYDLCSTRDEILVSETVGFINELRRHTQYMVQLFNGRLSDESLRVRMLDGSSPVDGFSLSRNGIVLHFGSTQSGAIHFNCLRKGRVSEEDCVLSTGFVEAVFSTFHDVHWTFLGEHVTSEKVACHFLTEFLQVSRFSSVHIK